MDFAVKKLGPEFVSFVLLIVLIAIKIALSYYSFGINVEFTRWLFLISAAVSGLCIYFACKSYGCFKLYSLIVLSVCAASCCLELSYSVLDENAHFEYVMHILDTGTLPVIGDPWSASAVNSVNFGETSTGYTNHEAVQAPLYYLFLSIFGSFIKSKTACFIIFRLVGLVFAVCTAVCCNKLTKKLFGLSVVNSSVCRLLLLLTILSPGYLYRATRMNNEIMVCLFFVVLMYQYFLSFIDNKSYRYWLVSLTAVLLFLTKNTAIYCMVFPILLAAFHIRDSRKVTVVVSLALFCLITIPWFQFNLANYHALTGAQKHYEVVNDWWQVNPYHIGCDFFDAFFNYLPLSFYSAEEFLLHPSSGHFVFFVYILLLIILASLACRTALSFCNINKSSASCSNEVKFVNVSVGVLYVAVILLAAYLLNYITDRFVSGSYLIHAILIICFALLLAFTIFVYRKLIALFRNYRISIRSFDYQDKKNLHLIVNVTCVAVILMTVAVLVSGSIVSSILAVRGRYFYPMIPALCLLMLNNKDCIRQIAVKHILKASAIVMLAFVSVDVFSGVIYRTMDYQNWLSDGVAVLSASDLTDNNWKKGVLADGKRILLDYSPNMDYSLLRGRVFVNNGEYAWVDREARAGKYEHLYLKNSIDQQKINDTKWLNLDKFSLKKYNFGGDRISVGAVNGLPLSQSFTAKACDSLIGFSVEVATYAQPNLSLAVDYKLIDSNGESILTKGVRHLEGINDNQWVEILFDRPVSVKKNSKYRIEFSLNTNNGKSVTVYAVRNDAYSDGEFQADIAGLDKNSMDLTFGLIQN